MDPDAPREKSITFTHEMTNDATGEVAASTTLVGVAMDTTTRRARALPSDVRERAVAMIGELAEAGVAPQCRGRRALDFGTACHCNGSAAVSGGGA